MWIARDKDYVLHLFVSVKPIRKEDKWVSVSGTSIEINESYFEDLTWEHEPIKATLCQNNEEHHTIKPDELSILYHVDWAYTDMEETLKTCEDKIERYNLLPWYKRLFTNI